MKICLYSPYLPNHFGGGEKYLLDVALILADYYSVFIAVPKRYEGDTTIIKNYQFFLNKSLAKISFISSPLGSNQNFLSKLLWTKKFDVLYYLTDGSLFFSLANKNILHVQFPLKLDKSSIIEQLKLKNWQLKNTNSNFTKEIIESSWPVKIDLVHQPLVDVNEIVNQVAHVKKENVILSVGRFFRHLHCKRQDILIDAFRILNKKYPQELKSWKLVLIGNVEDLEYLALLKRKKRRLKVEFYHDLDRNALLNWYGRAKIYWHAAGYQVDEKKYPQNVEHFGISTAEAMAAGCIPFAINKGGQKEVLGNHLVTNLWTDLDELIEKTIVVMKNYPAAEKSIALIKKQVIKFDKSIFKGKLLTMIKE